MDRQDLIDAVLEEIKSDVSKGDVTAIECLISNLDDETLKAYLPESK